MASPRPLSSLPWLHLGIGLATAALVVIVRPTEGDPLSLWPIADRVAAGAVPYRDFPLEYPPLALLPIVVPRLIAGTSLPDYVTVFSLIAAAFAAATGTAVYWLARRGWSATAAPDSVLVFVGLCLAAAPLVVWRFDIMPTLLAALGLVAYSARRPAWAGFALGLGVGAKLFPAFAAPVLAAALAVERRFRSLALLIGGAAIAVVALTIELLIAAGPGAFSFLLYQERRGVEVESVTGGLALLAHVLTGSAADISFGFGAWQVQSPVLATLALPDLLFELCLVAVLLAGAWLVARRDLRAARAIAPQSLVRYIAATLLVVILANKVLSPQYLVWLLPLVALLPRRQSLLCAVTLALTTLIYPLSFGGLLELEPTPVIGLNVRNALLIVLFAWLVVPDLQRKDVREAADQPGHDAEDEQAGRQARPPWRDNEHQ